MMKTLSSIRAQIEKLQKEEEEFINRERDGVIQRCLEAIVTYNIQIPELFGERIKKMSKEEVFKSKITYVFGATYTDGVHTWVGRGPVPTWIRESGKDISEFLTDAPLVPHSTRLGRKA